MPLQMPVGGCHPGWLRITDEGQPELDSEPFTGAWHHLHPVASGGVLHSECTREEVLVSLSCLVYSVPPEGLWLSFLTILRRRVAV